MHSISRSAEDTPLYRVATTRRIEARALAAVSESTLVRRAGTAVARLVVALAPHASRVLVLAGPGNNGADGVEAGLALHAAGKQVTVVQALPPVGAEALTAAQRARTAGIALVSMLPPPEPTAGDAVIVDALLGIGASRAPHGPIGSAIAWANAHTGTVLAVDVPSGLDADRGMPLGGQVVRATATLAMLVAKPGLFTGLGRDHAGGVWLDTLGAAIDEPADAWLSGHQATGGLVPVRQHAQHKGSFGQVWVVGGAAGMTGAAWLAGRAALLSGGGRVYLGLLGAQPDAGAHRQAHADAPPGPWPELMIRGPDAADAGWLRATTVVCGCGGGAAVAQAIPPLVAHALRLVLDADALNALARDAVLADAVARRGARGGATVLTPHPLEAARLLGIHTDAVQADRCGAAQALAQRFGAVVVLKGSGSIVAAPGRPPFINPTGNAALATAGTGDVLAGWIGGRMAASPAEAGAADAGAALQRIVAAAVHRHGAATDGCDPGLPLPAGRLIDRMALG